LTDYSRAEMLLAALNFQLKVMQSQLLLRIGSSMGGQELYLLLQSSKTRSLLHVRYPLAY